MSSRVFKWLLSEGRSPVISVLCSILIHGLFFFALIQFSSRSREPQPNETVRIEIKEPMDTMSRLSRVKKLRNDGKIKGGHAHARSIDLGLLGPRLNADLQGALGFNHGNDGGMPDNPYAEWGEGAGEFGRISDTMTMQKLKEAIDGLLYYPGVLARHGISGVVNARLVLKEHGECDWAKTSINSGDKHLQIYVLSVLRKFCGFNLALLSTMRKNSNVDMSFRFELTERPQDEIPTHELIVGNVLLFNRNSQHSQLEWHLGPLMGVFPFPAVNIDFFWLKEHWDQYVNSKAPLHELENES